MKLISRIIWGILFLVVFFVASKNMDKEATLNLFFLDYELNGPLPLVLLCFMVIGFVLGVTAMMPAFFRYRRNLSKQKKAMVKMQKENEAQQLLRSQPPPPDTIAGA